MVWDFSLAFSSRFRSLSDSPHLMLRVQAMHDPPNVKALDCAQQSRAFFVELTPGWGACDVNQRAFP